VPPFLIHPHQARVAGHVCGEDCGETADRRHCSPGVRCLNKVYSETGGAPSVSVGRLTSNIGPPRLAEYASTTSSPASPETAVRSPTMTGWTR
jgi:hypothetical protein